MTIHTESFIELKSSWAGGWRSYLVITEFVRGEGGEDCGGFDDHAQGRVVDFSEGTEDGGLGRVVISSQGGGTTVCFADDFGSLGGLSFEGFRFPFVVATIGLWGWDLLTSTRTTIGD